MPRKSAGSTSATTPGASSSSSSTSTPASRRDTVRRHLAEYAYPCRGLLDPEHALVARCHATATPEAVVFGKDRAITYQGRVDDRYADLGRPRDEPTTHDLADAIEATVLGRPVAVPRTKAVGCRDRRRERLSESPSPMPRPRRSPWRAEPSSVVP